MENGDLVRKAQSWAASLRQKSVNRWSGRIGQDRSYREHVIHPAIHTMFREYATGPECRLLEAGCGDGSFLDDPSSLTLLSNGDSYFGIDISTDYIKKASENHPETQVEFCHGDLTDRTLAKVILQEHNNEFWNCGLSVFVIQEIADSDAFFANFQNLLADGAAAIIITVHPDFGEWLMDNGRMKTEPKIDGCADTANFSGTRKSWRWAGYYPIVDEPNEPFYLPYFHRTIEDYSAIMKNNGLTLTTYSELPKTQEDRQNLANSEISPFIPFVSNLYWPGIGEMPSSIAFIVRKEATGE